MPFLSGKEKCPREGFIYWSDDGDLMALRFQQYKLVFAEQNARGPRGLACAADADAHPQAL
jgi:arylsulfatase